MEKISRREAEPMITRGKRLTALLCAAAMALTLLPGRVWAETAALPEEDDFLSASVTCGNPLYPELGVEESVSYDAPEAVTLAAEDAIGDGSTFATIEEAAAYVRQQFRAREQMLFFYTGYPEGGPLAPLDEVDQSANYTENEQALVDGGASHQDIIQRRRLTRYLTTLVRQQLLPEAFRHDPKDPTGGDYMRYQYSKVRYSASWYGGVFGVTITFTYFTTAQQEAELDMATAELLNYLGVKGMTDYGKLKAIYGWVCDHVTYDYENLTDDTYLLMRSAYAAMIHKTAICQGYAVLLYRLSLMAGLDVRIVKGTGRGQPHGWNLVRMGPNWYFADSTWDAGRKGWSWFLKPTLDYHQLDDEDAAMTVRYPLGSADFSPEALAGERGKLNGGGDADVTDMQLLYDYLTTDAVPEGARDDGVFTFAADMNGDEYIDVYDLQALYETISSLRKAAA